MDKRGITGTSAQHISSPISLSPEHLDFCYSSLPYVEHQHSREPLYFQPIPSPFAGGIESYLDPKYISDPAAFASRLPFLPLPNSYAMYDWGFEPAFIRKRNERERQRVKCVNEGYTRLREHLPREFAEKRLSKVETLRAAIQYIKQLQRTLGVETDKESIKQSADRYSRGKLQDTSDSDQDRRSDDTYPGKFADDESAATLSSRDDQLSSYSGENEEILMSELSPDVKHEAPSPSSNFAADVFRNNCAQKSSDFLFKGKIFCKTSQELAQLPKDKVSFENYQSSCCWVGNESFSHFHETAHTFSPEHFKGEKYKQQTVPNRSHSIEEESSARCHYNATVDNKNTKNASCSSSCNFDCRSSRKRAANNYSFLETNEKEKCFLRERTLKQTNQHNTNDRSFNKNEERRNFNALELDESPCSASKET